MEADAALWGHSTPQPHTPLQALRRGHRARQTDGPAAGTGKGGGALLEQRQMEELGVSRAPRGYPFSPPSGDRGKLVIAHKSQLWGRRPWPRAKDHGGWSCRQRLLTPPSAGGGGEDKDEEDGTQEEEERGRERRPRTPRWGQREGTPVLGPEARPPSPVLGEVMSEEVVGCQLNSLLGGDKGQVHGGSCGHIMVGRLSASTRFPVGRALPQSILGRRLLPSHPHWCQAGRGPGRDRAVLPPPALCSLSPKSPSRSGQVGALRNTSWGTEGAPSGEGTG